MAKTKQTPKPKPPVYIDQEWKSLNNKTPILIKWRLKNVDQYLRGERIHPTFRKDINYILKNIDRLITELTILLKYKHLFPVTKEDATNEISHIRDQEERKILAYFMTWKEEYPLSVLEKINSLTVTKEMILNDVSIMREALSLLARYQITTLDVFIRNSLIKLQIESLSF